MPYNAAMSPSAKKALASCIQTYGQGDEIHTWLRMLSKLASDGLDHGSVEVEKMIEGVFKNSEEIAGKGDWEQSWGFLKSATIVDWVAVVYHVITQQKPPLQLKAAKEEFCFLGMITENVVVFYEINHIRRAVIFRCFMGLPGQ